jgi:hypothetical protein
MTMISRRRRSSRVASSSAFDGNVVKRTLDDAAMTERNLGLAPGILDRRRRPGQPGSASQGLWDEIQKGGLSDQTSDLRSASFNEEEENKHGPKK